MTVAQAFADKINANTTLLEHCRTMKIASALSLITVDNSDNEEYQFHFYDGSILNVNQQTARAAVLQTKEEISQ